MPRLGHRRPAPPPLPPPHQPCAPGGPADCAPGPSLRLRLIADPLGVRAALAEVVGALRLAGAADPAAAELVLAEVLNNIAEHAYAAGPGPVLLRVRPLPGTAGGLAVTTLDRGAPMPGLALPAGAAPALDAAPGDLPEGGFGWFLIRRLARGLDYRRRAGCNRLRFRLVADRPDEG